MKKVIVFGTFDILHPGHVYMLNEAKKYGDYLIVVVARDSTVLQVKNHLPDNDEQTRATNLLNLRIADKVRLGNFDDKYLPIAEEKPDIVALGYDQNVFVDKLASAVEDHVQIVRLTSYLPEIYKSSKLKENKNNPKLKD